MQPENRQPTAAPLFSGPPKAFDDSASGAGLAPWLIAAAVIVAVLATALALTHHRAVSPANGPLPLDAYASSLVFGNLALSESTSLSGGKSTFVDGIVTNRGDRTLTEARLQVIFSNGSESQFPPQIVSLPLTVIRAHEPYIDIQPLSAAPLKPRETREFRLIFENISSSWDQSLPTIRLVGMKSGS